MSRIRKILGLCEHKRRIVNTKLLKRRGTTDYNEKYHVAYLMSEFVLRCEKCGNMKVVKTK